MCTPRFLLMLLMDKDCMLVSDADALRSAAGDSIDKFSGRSVLLANKCTEHT